MRRERRDTRTPRRTETAATTSNPSGERNRTYVSRISPDWHRPSYTSVAAPSMAMAIPAGRHVPRRRLASAQTSVATTRPTPLASIQVRARVAIIAPAPRAAAAAA
jgi:hypothetical protein